MKGIAFDILVLCALAVAVLVYTSATTVDVVPVVDGEGETAVGVPDQLAAKDWEGIYCELQGCCANHGGLDSIDLKTKPARVMCVDETESPSCKCTRKNSSAESGMTLMRDGDD